MGFGAGWLVFDTPIKLNGEISASDVETRLLKRERAAGRKADMADCEPRQASMSAPGEN